MNLKTRFGKQYRVELEAGGDKSDPLAYIMPCRHGHIFAHGKRTLGAATNSAGPIAKRLRAMPRVKVWQDGSDGLNVIFDVDDFDLIAELMRPRARRRLSPEHKAKLAAAAGKTRFRPVLNEPAQS
jgi:hypothetical protein